MKFETQVFASRLSFALLLACMWVALPKHALAQPTLIDAGADNTLTWSNNLPGLFSQIEKSTTLQPGSWSPFFYDSASNGLYQTTLPPSSDPTAFYRIGIITNIPDPSLVLHLSFDNDLSNGVLLDTSGYGNNGLKYSVTNWPGSAIGPDGSQAGSFTRASSGLSGSYASVPYSPNLDNLSNGTVLVWAYYTANSYGNTALIDAEWWEHTNSWFIGRNYGYQTYFAVSTGTNNGEVYPVTYPDYTLSYDTGGFHYYGVTWDGTNFTGYFDGLPISTYPQAQFPQLKIGGTYRWIAIGCHNHDGTPQFGDDAYPNNGWMGGSIDDVRIYNRALSSNEIYSIYNSFDHVPPTVPSNVSARAVSNGQIELAWNASQDNFRVAGYRITRDGQVVGTTTSSVYFDTAVAPATTYQYTVEAYDVGTNYSSASLPLTVTTPTDDTGPTSVILDDGDGFPYVNIVGSWSLRTNSLAYLGYFIQDDNTGRGTKSVTYTPSIPEDGTYNLYIWYPTRANGATAIPISIFDGLTTNTVYLNETVGGNTWKLLGSFSLAAGTNSTVTISNTGANNYVEADALMWTK